MKFFMLTEGLFLGEAQDRGKSGGVGAGVEEGDVCMGWRSWNGVEKKRGLGARY